MANFEDSDEQDLNAQEARKAKWRQYYRDKGLQLKPLVEAMQAVKLDKEERDEAIKDVNAHYDVLRFECVPESMENAGVENVRYDGIGRVGLTADVQVQLPKGNRETFFKWLRKLKMGSLIQEGVNSSTLKAFIKGRMKEGKEYPGDLVRVTPIIRASITKG